MSLMLLQPVHYMNLSASFILPVLELSCTIYKHGLIDTYLGDAEYATGWGEYLFVEMQNDSPHLEELTYNRHYIESYPRTEESTMYVFTVSDYYKDIIKPFLEGKYSKISRQYVVNNFPLVENNRRALNREILDKSPRIRAWQEDRIGVTLPSDVEVWDKPIQDKEVYGYKTLKAELV